MADLGIPGLGDAVEVGRGGFAAVYRAEQPAFNRTVAVKVLFSDRLSDLDLRRFDRERQTMGSLSSHRSIVTIYDAGYTEEGRPYLVMEFMARGSLADRLDDEGPLGWHEVTEVGLNVAEALAAAHARGIVHRDVKPANVLVSEYGHVQLSDFGIARVDGATRTESSVITATLAHAAPEILDGAEPTPASDIYSLGSTLYELLEGEPAFMAGGNTSLVVLIRRIVTDDIADLREHGHPDALATVIERAMAKDPADRYASAGEMAADLRRVEVLAARGDAASDAAAPRTSDDDPDTTSAPADSSGDTPVAQATDEPEGDDGTIPADWTIATPRPDGRRSSPESGSTMITPPADVSSGLDDPVSSPSNRGRIVAGVVAAAVIAVIAFLVFRPGDDGGGDTVAGGSDSTTTEPTGSSASTAPDSTTSSTTDATSPPSTDATTTDPPSTTTGGAAPIPAPAIVDPAGSEVLALGLRPVRTLRSDDAVPAGVIIDQDPAPGAGVTTGNVHLTVSLGPQDAPEASPCPGPVALDGIIVGSLDTEGEVDSCTFEAAAGDLIELEVVVGGPISNRWMIVGPDGGRVCTTAGTCRIDVTGTQTLTIEDFERDDFGTYLVNIQRVSSVEGCPTILLGDIVEDQLTVDGDWDCYRVDLTENDLVRITMTASQGLAAVWNLYGPDGDRVCRTGGRCLVDETAPHRLTVLDIGLEDVGTYRFNIQLANDTTGCAPVGATQVVTGTITTDGEFDCYALDAVEDSVVRIESYNSEGLFALWELYDSFGARVCSSATLCRIDETGPHRLVFEDVGLEDEGTYTFNVQRVDQVADCAPLYDDEAVTSSIDGNADYRCFAFEADEDDTIEIVLEGDPGLFPQYEVFDRFGVRVCRFGLRCQVDETATYRIVIEDVALDDAGGFTITASRPGG